jgi:hypothetical protein
MPTADDASGAGKVLATVVNYEFSEAADRLKAALAPAFPTVLIDSSSPHPPRTVDRVIPNQFKPGLWNESLRIALEARFAWVLMITSDVEVPDPARLSRRITKATRRADLGVYTPSLRADSRMAYPLCRNLGSGGLRECFLIEGFCMVAAIEHLNPLYPVDRARNKYGWGIDVMICRHAYQSGRKAYADDAVEIYHPRSVHEIRNTVAAEQARTYLGPEGWAFRRWARKRIRQAERRARWLAPWWWLRRTAPRWIGRSADDARRALSPSAARRIQ